MGIVDNRIIFIGTDKTGAALHKIPDGIQSAAYLRRAWAAYDANDFTCQLSGRICRAGIHGLCIDHLHIRVFCGLVKGGVENIVRIRRYNTKAFLSWPQLQRFCQVLTDIGDHTDPQYRGTQFIMLHSFPPILPALFQVNSRCLFLQHPNDQFRRMGTGLHSSGSPFVDIADNRTLCLGKSMLWFICNIG